ncbi:MAG TPA: enoyl-CoA hydratase/isomerase family protein, partial [Bdellovibrionota bacterium]|nr:enoyl-CoA hydratase/isomerase family protein [Bdellovibrionota bacterium]
MSEPHLLFETEGDLGIATFQRAEVHHAINPQTVKELERLLDYWERKANIKCLVLTATGTKSFVAGGDLKYFSEIMGNKMAGVKFHRHMRNAMKKLSNLPFPVICAANGDIYGGGCEIALSADLFIIAHHASVNFRQMEVGLTPGWGGGPKLVRRVGYNKACHLILTGAAVPAPEAQKMGLVEEVIEGDFQKGIREFASQITRYPQEVIHNNLKVLRAAGSKWWDVAHQMEVRYFERLWG